MGEGKTLDVEKQPLLLESEAAPILERDWTVRWLLLSSIILNIYMIWFVFWLFSLEPADKIELKSTSTNWAHHAAEGAEKDASFRCSDRGTVFGDTLQADATEVSCECRACFTGLRCEQAVPDCSARVDSGDPVMYEYFWKQNADAGTLVTPPWYRMSYEEGLLTDGSGATPSLEKEIRELHALVGNAAAEGRHLVIASGSSAILSAITLALAQSSTLPASLVAAVPFYELYKRQANMYAINYKWAGDAKTFVQQGDEPVIEYVTSPNNPDFLPRRPVLNTSHTIFDLAYNWPHMVPLQRFDEDIMVFTLSKITGHAGSRLGWAFFKDPLLASKVNIELRVGTLGVSRDIQARATKLISAVTAVYRKDNGSVPLGLSAKQYAADGRIFHYGRTTLQRRFQWLEKALSQSNRFHLQKHEPAYCAFYGQKLDPSPAYAWIYCTRDEDEDCYNVFLKGGIVTYPGVNYGVTNRYVRISLLKRETDYDLLAEYLPSLVRG